jgi:thiamine pyrophosphokinase
MKVNIVTSVFKKINHINPNFFTILLDGAFKYKKTFPNSITVGDGDSNEGDNSQFDYPLPTIKNSSDLTYGLSHIPKNTQEVFIYGAWDEELDHSLANLGEISNYCKLRKIVFHLYSTSQLKKAIIFNGDFKTKIQGRFSLLSIDSNTVSIEGDCQYKTKPEYPHHLRALSSLGIGNQGFGNVAFNSLNPLILVID